MFGSALSKITGGSKENVGGGEDEELELDFDDLLAKLTAAETRIRGLVSGEIPQIPVKLPRVEPKHLDLDGHHADAQEGSRDLEVGAASDADPLSRSTAATLEADVRPLLGAQAEGVSKDIKGRFEKIKSSLKNAAAVMVSSLALVVGTAMMGLSPLISTLISTVASTVGFATSWYTRAHQARSKVKGHIDESQNKVLRHVETAKKKVDGLASDVTTAIDDMAEEQKGALDKIKQLERTLKVDVPDPSDLKKPVDGCTDKLTGVFRRVEEEVPKGVTEVLNRTHVGKLGTDEKRFNILLVALPVAGVLLMNSGAAVGQLALQGQFAAQTAQGAASQGIRDFNRTIEETDLGPFQGLVDRSEEVDWKSYLSPWVVQIGLMVTQVAFGFLMTKGEMLAPPANTAIEHVEQRAHNEINGGVKRAVDDVMGGVFDEVRGKCDDFFPKFKDALVKAKEAQALAGKAGALADKVGGFADKF